MFFRHKENFDKTLKRTIGAILDPFAKCAKWNTIWNSWGKLFQELNCNYRMLCVFIVSYTLRSQDFLNLINFLYESLKMNLEKI